MFCHHAAIRFLCCVGSREVWLLQYIVFAGDQYAGVCIDTFKLCFADSNDLKASVYIPAFW